ncbi:MAG: uroporphyrinogen-III synthase [Calditrichaeota bacterium]|nr:uroporphyrinogen-III synthase [Calditrichota bacterium]RQW08644.1 MAG: uroporphyrinogen-III synthase [Calditrichota bacterium]
MILQSKKILICRQEDRAAELAENLRKKGAIPTVFPTFQIQEIPLNEMALDKFKHMKKDTVLAAGSPNAIKFLRKLFKQTKIPCEILQNIPIYVVGDKTAKAFESYFPGTVIIKIYPRLQILLDDISETYRYQSITVINPTSRQSLHNIKLTIPANLVLHRIPLYETVSANMHKKNILSEIRNKHFDAIIFSSPSSFDGFIDIMGEGVFSTNPVIVAFGPTTALHLRDTGKMADVIPSAPKSDKIIDSLEKFFTCAEQDVQ